MRAALLLVLLLGCRTANHFSAERLLDQARHSLRSERFAEGLRLVEQAIQASGQGARASYRARLLKAELLLANREARAAQEALAFELPADAEWDRDRGRLHLLRGHAAVLLGDRDAAAQHLDQASSLARTSNDPQLAAEVRLRRGSLLVRAGEFDKAAAEFRAALQFAERQSDTPLLLAATGNFGFLELRAHRYEDAIGWFERTLSLARYAGAPVSAARAQGNLGSACFRLGDYERALEYFSGAEKSFDALGNRFEQQIWRGNQGNVQLELRQLDAARASFTEALAIARRLDNAPWTATWLSNLARTAIERHAWDEAETSNREALQLKQKLKDPEAVAFSLNNAARIAAGRRQFPQSLAFFNRVLAASKDPVVLLEAHAGIAQVHIASGDQPAAARALRAALAFGRKQRLLLEQDESRLTFFSKLIGLHQDYVEFLLAGRRVEDALQAAESSRAQVLSGRFRESHFAAHADLPRLKRLSRTHNQVFLSYWLAPRRSLLWIIAGGSVQVFALPPEAEIRRMVNAYNDVLQAQRDPLETAHPAGTRLTGILLEPVRHLIPQDAAVAIVPDGALHALNFETLPVAGAASRRYFGETVTVRLAPWLSAAAGSESPRRAAPRAVLLIGDAVPSDAFGRLEFARAEMTAIGENLQHFERLSLSGPHATADAYRASSPHRFAWIHFAAHAAASSVSPLDSAVILSPPHARLAAREIMAQRLDAELVTISACRSGGTRIFAGEGMVGLSWAFLRAGARNVVAALWNVNDRSTSILMTRLYQELARGAAPPDALHRAKLDLIRGAGPYRKPYYWAPFQLYTAGLRLVGDRPAQAVAAAHRAPRAAEETRGLAQHHRD